ncbi:MAG: hypothetical protein VXV96_18820 [Bdellovibrionota bacterium]|nr:hypothetical protein [Bdellovibrionota bacterium]
MKIFLSSILFLFLFDSSAKDIICKRLDSTHPYAKKSRRKVRVGDEFKYIYQMNMDLYEKKPILQGKIIISGLQFLEKSYKLDPLKDITCDLSNGILICPKRPVSVVSIFLCKFFPTFKPRQRLLKSDWVTLPMNFHPQAYHC